MPYNDRLTILLRLCGLLFLILFIHLLAESVSKKKRTLEGYWPAYIITVCFAVAHLSISLYYSTCGSLNLFNPVIYGSNFVQRSLGDLLVNSVLFCWFVLFAWSKLQQKEKSLQPVSGAVKMGGRDLVALYLLIFSTFILASVIRSFVADSKISFDVTDFFSLNQYYRRWVLWYWPACPYPIIIFRSCYSVLFFLFSGKEIS